MTRSKFCFQSYTNKLISRGLAAGINEESRIKTNKLSTAFVVSLWLTLPSLVAQARDTVTITPGGVTVEGGDGSVTKVKPGRAESETAVDSESAKPKKRTANAIAIGPDGGQTVSIDCKGRAVVIESGANKVVLKGECGALTLNGAYNVVSVESTPAITVVGLGNKVTWLKPLNGQAPRISDQAGNSVIVQKNTQAVPAGKKAAPASRDAQIEEQKATATAPAQAEETDQSFDQGKRIVVGGNENNRTLDCRGKDVQIVGNENVLVFRGECGSVSVLGNENKLTLQAARAISIPGNDNKVVWRDGVGGKAPKVSNFGSGNHIAQANR